MPVSRTGWCLLPCTYWSWEPLWSPLIPQFSGHHIPWRERTRRQKLIIVIFYGLFLILIINVAGWLAYLCVFRQAEKYRSKEVWLGDQGHRWFAYLSHSSSRCKRTTANIDFSTAKREEDEDWGQVVKQWVGKLTRKSSKNIYVYVYYPVARPLAENRKLKLKLQLKLQVLSKTD